MLAPNECMEGDIRLIGGQRNNEGRIEVCAKTFIGVLRWGSVCSDRWDKDDATVACRQLNMPGLLTMIIKSTHSQSSCVPIIFA